MNIYISPWIAIVVVAVVVFFRFLKRGKRRCCGKYLNQRGELVNCGSFRTKGAHFIFLPPEERELFFPAASSITPLPKKIVSWRRPVSTVRWFSRRVIQEILSIPILCPSTPLPKKIVSWHRPVSTVRWFILGRLFKGTPRFYVRRAVKVTLRYHIVKNREHRWIQVEKFDMSSTSLWHLMWTKWFDDKQYEPPKMEYKLAIYGFLRQFYHHERPAELDKNTTDTPELVEAFIEDFLAFLWGEED